MRYKGIEIKEFTSNKPVVFCPTKKMLVWDSDDGTPVQRYVLMYHPRYIYPVICVDDSYMCCAEIPEEPKPRRATNNELAKWLAQGNGQFANVKSTYFLTELGVLEDDEDKPCDPYWRIRKWDDKEWHEPTADYMGLEG